MEFRCRSEWTPNWIPSIVKIDGVTALLFFNELAKWPIDDEYVEIRIYCCQFPLSKVMCNNEEKNALNYVYVQCAQKKRRDKCNETSIMSHILFCKMHQCSDTPSYHVTISACMPNLRKNGIQCIVEEAGNRKKVQMVARLGGGTGGQIAIMLAHCVSTVPLFGPEIQQKWRTEIYNEYRFGFFSQLHRIKVYYSWIWISALFAGLWCCVCIWLRPWHSRLAWAVAGPTKWVPTQNTHSTAHIYIYIFALTHSLTPIFHVQNSIKSYLNYSLIDFVNRQRVKIVSFKIVSYSRAIFICICNFVLFAQ